MSKFADLRALRAVRDQQAHDDQDTPPTDEQQAASQPVQHPEEDSTSHLRRPGKRRDATFTKATVYINKKAYLEAKSRMMLAGRKGEVSDLLSALLIGYLKGEFEVKLPDIEDE